MSRALLILILAALSAIPSALAGGQADAPGQNPPLVVTPPSIGGTYRERQTLAADVGTWSGPGRSYAYQWVRCDGAGLACTPINAADRPLFLVTAADVRYTLRVVVVASNKNGATVATSHATPVIAPALSTDGLTTTSIPTSSSASSSTSTTTPKTTTTTTTTRTTTTTTTTTSSTPPYFSDDFEGGFGKWNEEPNSASLFLSVAGYSGRGAGLLTTSSSPGPPNSQLTSLWLYPDDSHAGWAGGRVLGQDSWYRVRMNFSSRAYAPTTGQWNWLVGWHNDNHTASYGAVSTDLGVYTDYPVVNGGIGLNPRLVLRLAGGNSTSPTYQSIELAANSLQYDHWYDLLFHFVWHTSSATGLVQWWVDGVQQAGRSFPTLFTNPDGTSSYNTFGVYNYHLAAPWASEVDVDNIAIGPSRASVGG